MNKTHELRGARRGRDPKRESFWREVLSRQHRGGLTAHAFCQRERLKESAFYYWRREIGRRDREAAAGAGPVSSFVELRAAPTTISPFDDALGERDGRESFGREAPLELLLPGDRRLRIGRGCDGGLLTMVLNALSLPAASVAPLSLSNGSNRPAVSLSNREAGSC
jgi:hypothetical protein